MTLDQIRESDRLFLVPTDVAGVLGCNPQSIRDVARKEPEKLGFPVCVIGTRIRIPRVPFMEFIGEEAAR